MPNIHIVVDSTACLPAEMLNAHGNLHEVALTVRLGSKQWPETDLTSEELFKLVDETNQHPSTSQPATGDFINIFTPIIENGGEIVVITVSGGLSGTSQGARVAADMVSGKHIAVVDSCTAAGAMIEMAKTALRLAEEGRSLTEITEELQRMVKVTKTIFIPGTLNYLHKGGRIGGAATIFGTILQIKPILHLIDGKVAVLDKVRTRNKAIARMVDEVQKCSRFSYINVGYNQEAMWPEAEQLISQLQTRFPDTTVVACTIGPTLSAHLGPETIGIIYQESL